MTNHKNKYLQKGHYNDADDENIYVNPQDAAHDYFADIEKAYAERLKKDERSDKRDSISTAIAGIGDTVGALGNLYFTTKYASPIPQTEGMSDKMRERYEAAKAKRDRNRAEWMNYMLNIAGRKQAAEQAEANRKTTEAYHNTIIAQRGAAAQAAADAKAADAEEKNKKEKEKQRVDNAVVKYETDLFSKYPKSVPYNRDAEIKLLEQQWENGEITDDEYKAKFKAAKQFNNGYKQPKSNASSGKPKERPGSPASNKPNWNNNGKRNW